MLDSVETRLEVEVQYPVHLSFLKDGLQGLQGLVLTLAGPKSVAEGGEVAFVDAVEDFYCRRLDDLVFDVLKMDRALASVWLGQIDAFGRGRFVGSRLESLVQFLYPSLQSLSIAGFGLSVGAGRGVGPQAPVAAQQGRFGEVVRQ